MNMSTIQWKATEKLFESDYHSVYKLESNDGREMALIEFPIMSSYTGGTERMEKIAHKYLDRTEYKPESIMIAEGAENNKVQIRIKGDFYTDYKNEQFGNICMYIALECLEAKYNTNGSKVTSVKNSGYSPAAASGYKIDLDDIKSKVKNFKPGIKLNISKMTKADLIMLAVTVCSFIASMICLLVGLRGSIGGPVDIYLVPQPLKYALLFGIISILLPLIIFLCKVMPKFPEKGLKFLQADLIPYIIFAIPLWALIFTMVKEEVTADYIQYLFCVIGIELVIGIAFFFVYLVQYKYSALEAFSLVSIKMVSTTVACIIIFIFLLIAFFIAICMGAARQSAIEEEAREYARQRRWF